jgi:flavin reductase
MIAQMGDVPCVVAPCFVCFDMAPSTTAPGISDPQDSAVTHELFRRVMASFVTGVTVVTTQVGDEIRGMTANAFMSGSLDPPLCVISVSIKARMHGYLLKAGHFGVNILARGQEALIDHFAGRPGEAIEPKYEYAESTPLFAHAQATIAAKVTARHACGDHTLFVGHIFALRHAAGVSPIVLHVGRLASLVHSHEQTIWPTLDFW